MADCAVRKDARGLVADADILARIAAGDMAAFELLMRRYNRLLYRTARSIVRDDAEAEDVLQEAYLLIFRNVGSSAARPACPPGLPVSSSTRRSPGRTRTGGRPRLSGSAMSRKQMNTRRRPS